MRVLLLLAAVFVLSNADSICTGVNIDKRYYNLKIIKEGINHLSDLAFNRRENSLYFTFGDVTNGPNRLLGHLDLNTNIASVINGISNATSITIDNGANKVYVGSDNGLFKINERIVAERLPIQESIQDVLYKDGLYFSNKRKEVNRFEDGYATPVQELKGLEIDSFIIDDDNNIFYTKDKDLFRVKLGTRAVNTHERMKVNVLVTDIYSNAYVCTNDGIYAYKKYKYVFDKVADLQNLKAMTFNQKNEPFYAVSDLLVQLNLSTIGCFGD